MNLEEKIIVSDKKQQFQINIKLAGLVFIPIIWKNCLTIHFAETFPYIKDVFDPIIGQSFLNYWSVFFETFAVTDGRLQ